MPSRTKEDFGLSDKDVQLILFQDRYDQAWLTLGGTLHGRRVYRKIFSWILEGVRDWRLSQLAIALNMPRNTLRKCILDGLESGWVSTVDRQTYAATTKGIDVFLEIQRQTIAIAGGGQNGYSPQLIETLGKCPLMPVTAEAARISFPPTLNLIREGVVRR